MKINVPEELMCIVRDVQDRIEYIFATEEIWDILLYTKRKCEINGEGMAYIPILFENELRDYVVRKAITRAGGRNRCMKSAT